MLICLQINEQIISCSSIIWEGGPHRGLTEIKPDDEIDAILDIAEDRRAGSANLNMSISGVSA
ncbi:hypothetical protein CQ13_37405 [Bradyrhizobium retamae]|uniref:Uncharacterized protein n=1 Tax=Bradyrhizobium retamae TaxID=1300035 RepID=A0A0R3M457_9BRAD|nr:hypothetical protein CQ13_37405 [Bradyrhizobium retamae]